jgi:type 1 glutamine amidotransferase
MRQLPVVMGVVIACCLSISAAAQDQEDFQPIFDGQSLKGWDGDPRFWRVEDGAITGQTTRENPTSGNTFLIWRGGTVDDFELALKYRIMGGNSGVQYRSREVAKWVMAGYQADIDADGQFVGILYDERGRGILALRGKKVVIEPEGKKIEVGTTADEREIIGAISKSDWNEYTITARGNHLVQTLNGKVTVDVTDNQQPEDRSSGLLALQLHAGPPMKVQFKDIRLKRLAGQPKTSQGSGSATNGKKKVVFVAGTPSHGYGAHEHNAGCLLLAKELRKNMPELEVDVHLNGWPQDPDAAFAGADAIVMYCDGGSGHMVIPHLDQFDKLMKQGVGVACIHYAVEVPKGKVGDAMLDWIGGYFEMHWSVNPHWKADFSRLPDHPITRGVSPFAIQDEWYFHMRFRPDMEGVTPILTATPPESTMSRPDGTHSGNPHVRAAMANRLPQHVAWAAERPDGGRGFGFTGGHFHWNWGDDNFRKLVLNAIVWIAHGQVPPGGVSTQTPSREDLEANQDEPKPQPKTDTANPG